MGWAALLGNIWFRRAAIVAAVVVLLFFAAQYFEHKGAVQARQDSAQQVARAIEQGRTKDRSELEERLKPFQEQAAAAKTKADSAQQLFLTVLAQRGAATQQQAGMNDAQISAAVRSQIGDLADPAVQRSILSCRTQLPLCEQEVAHQADIASANAARTDAVQGSYDELAGYTEKLEGHYTDLWNAKSTPVRSWKCVKLWRCSRPQIKTPDPATLRRPVQTSAVVPKGKP